MSKRKAPSEALVDGVSKFALNLLKRVEQGTVPAQADGVEAPVRQPVDLETQIAALNVFNRTVAIIHRIHPPAEDDSQFDKLRSKLGVGPASRTKTVGRAGGETTKAPNGARGTVAYPGGYPPGTTISDTDG